MKIAIIGSHGLPAKYGGFETFAEEISLLLVKNGFEVAVQCDKNTNGQVQYEGVNLKYSTVTKTVNPLKYYFEGLSWSLKNYDIILVLGSGGAIFYYFWKPKGKVIITNTDGIEAKRPKWSPIHKLFLKISEKIAVRLSDYVIADSLSIKKHLQELYNIPDQKIKVIEYGAHINESPEITVLAKYNLEINNYYLVVCRLEPENNLSMILEGYQSTLSEKPLIIVGNKTDNNYVRDLIVKYSNEKVRFINGIYNKYELASLRYFCKAYIHGHSVGGTNPSLLEAMGNRNFIICHDNQFNREVTDNSQSYFKNHEEFTQIIRKTDSMNDIELEVFRQKSLNRILDYYNWENILVKYMALFSDICRGKSF